MKVIFRTWKLVPEALPSGYYAIREREQLFTALDKAMYGKGSPSAVLSVLQEDAPPRTNQELCGYLDLGREWMTTTLDYLSAHGYIIQAEKMVHWDIIPVNWPMMADVLRVEVDQVEAGNVKKRVKK